MSEEFVRKIIERAIPFCKNKIGLDVGANHGGYTSSIADMCLIAYAFEPCLSNFEILQHNVQNTNVIFVNEAVSCEDGNVKLFHCATNAGGHSIAAGVTSQTIFGHTPDDFEEVRCMKLDTYFKDRKDIGFMKIDVEAAELMVLQGATQTLNTNQIIIALETHQTVNLSVLFNYMQQHGYVFLDENWLPVMELVGDRHYCMHNLDSSVF